MDDRIATKPRTKPASTGKRAAHPETAAARQDPLRVVTVGHVDHGKSTLVGRLLHDTGSLPEGKVEAVAEMCRRRGMPFEWAFVTDALRAERDQGITIDVSHIWFRTAARDYVLLDAPGHREFLRNMVTGAAASDAALLVIDAAEGVRDQSKRHGFLLSLLGVRQVVVAVNKMDLVGYSESRFAEVARDISSYLESVGVTAQYVIPVSSREGDNIVTPSANMPWCTAPTIVAALDRFHGAPRELDLPLRLPVQDIYKFDTRRIIAGRIEVGQLAVGDTLLFSPSNKSARIASIEAWNTPAPVSAVAGESVGITLSEQIFVERGEIASHVEHAPVLTDVFRARVFWLGEKPLSEGQRYLMKYNTAEIPVEIQKIERAIDTTDLIDKPTDSVARDMVADIVLRARRLVALDDQKANIRAGRFVLMQDFAIVGGGAVSMTGYPDQRKLMGQKSQNLTGPDSRVAADMRSERNGHPGGVLWFTGLSGSGKSTIAIAVEQHLFALGYQVYVLDGDNVRRGLNTNLGFSPDDRAENIRRVGEVAALFADAGMIVISAFISPYRSDRERARHGADRLGGDHFREIYIQAPLSICESRDPKGLYKLARAGKISDFTGISAPYEPPEKADLVVDTTQLSIDAAVESVVDYIRLNFPLRQR